MCAHFKGVYARYWILQLRGVRAPVTAERVFPPPGQSNSGDRTPQPPPPSSSSPLHRWIWGFLSGHDLYNILYEDDNETAPMQGRCTQSIRYNAYYINILRKFSSKYNIRECNIITRCYVLFTKWILIGFTCRWLCGFFCFFLAQWRFDIYIYISQIICVYIIIMK